MKPLHIVWVLANNSSAPYFSWFAQRAQGEKDVRFSFVCLYPEMPEMIAEMEALGHKAYWVPFDDRLRSRSMLGAFPKLVKLFRRIRPDVVHAHLFDDAVPALAAARVTGVKMRVITKGDAAFHWYFAPKGVKYDRLNNRNATHIVALSEESRRFILEKEQADPKKLRLVHHGVPDRLTVQSEEKKQALRHRFQLGEEHLVIGTVSRLIAWKGYRQIIEAAALLVPEFPQLRFLFTGQGEQKAALEQLIREKNLAAHIQFTGWVSREEMPSLYGIMNVYLHAAKQEPFGFVIAEALLNGVPVVSTPTGAAGDAIRDGVNGFFAKEQEAHAIATALRKMLLLSPDERKTIGEKGKQSARELFTFEQMWRNHMALYQENRG